MPENERRRTPRTTHFSEAQMEGLDANPVGVRIADLSPEGAFVDSRMVLPEGASATLRFNVLGRELVVAVTVAYSQPPYGMGVRFDRLSPADRDAIVLMLASAGR
jgi:hypothetical protein